MALKQIRDISIFIAITVVVWILYEIYMSTVTTTIPKVQQELATPLNTDIDEEFLQSLSERIYYFRE